jgi:hypothetical protein
MDESWILPLLACGDNKGRGTSCNRDVCGEGREGVSTITLSVKCIYIGHKSRGGTNIHFIHVSPIWGSKFILFS